MVKKSTVEKWELPKKSLDVNDAGDVVSINCKFVKNTAWMMKAERSSKSLSEK